MTRPELSRAHFPALDALRGVAIVVVLFHNLSIFVPHGTLVDKLWNAFVESGWVGVQLFFVLSGFLITGILLEDRGAPRALRSFYVRRALRIFPLYYALLIVYFAILPRVFPALQRPATEAVWYWLFLSNWSWLAYGILPGIGHLWSLAVEEQFYVVWPWAALRAQPRTLAGVCVAIVLGSLATRGALHAAHVPDLWLYSATVCRADALAMGALVALAVRSDVWRARLARALRPVGVGALVALAALMVMTHGLNRNNPLIQTWGYSLIAILSAVLVAAAARPDAPALRVLGFFGKYSYAIYLVHPPLKHLAHHLLHARLDARMTAHPIATDAAFIVALSAASIVIALATWAVIERPALALKERFAPR